MARYLVAESTPMQKQLCTALVLVLVCAGTAFSKTDPFLVTPCGGVGLFTLGMTEDAVVRVAEKGALKDETKEFHKLLKELMKENRDHLRDEIRIPQEEALRNLEKDGPIQLDAYTYTYPRTKITLRLRFSDARLSSIDFDSPKLRTKEGVTLANYLDKENARYVRGVTIAADGSVDAEYFLPGLYFGTTPRQPSVPTGTVGYYPFCMKE
jgi:hypothetical protein